MAFKSGKNARAICERCGFEYPYRATAIEPGTNLRVCKEECYDGRWNRVTHPLNFPPQDLVDTVALEDPSPDRNETTQEEFQFVETSGGYASYLLKYKKTNLQNSDDTVVLIDSAKQNLRIKGVNRKTATGSATITLYSAGSAIESGIRVSAGTSVTAYATSARVSSGADLTVQVTSASGVTFLDAVFVVLPQD